MHNAYLTAQDPQQLTSSLLLRAYRQGWFPMANPITGRIEWFNPDPRAIIPLDEFHIPRNLAREIRQRRFEIRCDNDFVSVIRACSLPRRDDDLSWIDHRIIEAYLGLHHLGLAHSIEAWRDGRLVGGLYGVHLGAGFFGESMFARSDIGGGNSSKVCLVHLVQWLRHRGCQILDTQFRTDHLNQFGCREIRRRTYLATLADAVARDVTWGHFRTEVTEGAVAV